MDTEKTSTSITPLAAQIAGLKGRLARAESDRDTWRDAGMQENYLGACSMVDALTLQLDRLEETARLPAAASATTMPPTEPPAVSPNGRGRERAELYIPFNGRKYGYRGYRYDRFADAANYARLDRSRAFADRGVDDSAPGEAREAGEGSRSLTLRRK